MRSTLFHLIRIKYQPAVWRFKLKTNPIRTQCHCAPTCHCQGIDRVSPFYSTSFLFSKQRLKNQKQIRLESTKRFLIHQTRRPPSIVFFVFDTFELDTRCRHRFPPWFNCCSPNYPPSHYPKFRQHKKWNYNYKIVDWFYLLWTSIAAMERNFLNWKSIYNFICGIRR